MIARKRRQINYRGGVKDLLLRGVTRVALGEPAVRLLARKRRRGPDSMLDRQVAGVLELQRLMKLPALDSMEPGKARKFAEAGLSPLDLPAAPMAQIIDTKVGTIPVRIYVPHDASNNWIVYLHGGGGVIGSIRASEPATRTLAAKTRCTVASVEYRLGPEHRHPAAIEDACAAWDAMAQRVPAGGKLAVAGDSFGGFLSAHVDHYARIYDKRRPDLQVLLYPIVDMTLVSPSIDKFADGYLLTRSMIHWFRNNYLSPSDDRRTISPTYWDVHGASAALVVTAGFDPLVDEGDRYAEQLTDAGVAVRHRRQTSLVHGFLSLAGGVRAARTAVDLICSDIVDLLSAPPFGGAARSG